MDGLVTRVIADIIKFILLEEVRCIGRVASLKKVLLGKKIERKTTCNTGLSGEGDIEEREGAGWEARRK